MQKLIEVLKGFDIEIPEDKTTDVKRALSEHYKNVGELNKVTQKLEAERDDWKKRAETAEETLKGFEGIDPTQIQSQLDEAKRKVEEAQKDAEKRLAERDFNDALKTELDGYKFTSAAARKSVEADIRAAELKIKDGKILGLSDLIEQIKEADSSAFVDEQQQQLEAGKARFTQPMGNSAPTPGTKMSISQLMKLKNENPNLNIKDYM